MTHEQITHDDLIEALGWMEMQGENITSIDQLVAYADEQADLDFTQTPENLITEWATSFNDYMVEVWAYEMQRLPMLSPGGYCQI